ncbi:MAG TPA: formylglycine-generating enzyme family protein, partial [Candidatus Sumerlaeota bacterium]|nr:formylglycine-generating enzyme family protein [Candidatus Sumerlaeota bacterium]
DPAGQQLDVSSNVYDVIDSSAENGKTGWALRVLRLQTGEWPERVDLRLRYTLLPWKKEGAVSSDFDTSKNRIFYALPHGIRVQGVGQDTDGDAFISITRDMAVDPDILNSFVAITFDGRRRMCRSSFKIREGQILPEKLKVQTPLSQIQEFRLLSRPFREVEFKNVILRPDPGKAQKPEAQGAQTTATAQTITPVPTSTTTATVPSASPDDTLINSLGMKLKRIPAGSFVMGSPENEKARQSWDWPQHKVTLTRPFYMGTYEVTQEQYEKVMGTNPSTHVAPRNPVETVTWEEAELFCQRLSKIEGQEYRLPTEAEWEYACRAGTQTAFYWGDALDERFAWLGSNRGNNTHEVGMLLPNAWGLYDISGNVGELCSDYYTDTLSGDEDMDPKGSDSESRGEQKSHVVRGGRSAGRGGSPFNARFRFIGFRVVRVSDEKAAERIPPAPQTTATASTGVTTATVPSETPDGVLTNSIGMQLKLIPAGSFVMGSIDGVVPSNGTSLDEAIPPHQVTLTQPFYLGVYEVTQEQYEKVMGTHPDDPKNSHLPVEGVSWEAAQDFCWILTNQERTLTYRLPTEAEWEYAARAGTTTRFYWGDELDAQYAVYGLRQKTQEVGTRKPNPWGLYDMIGNACEWCEDWYEYPDITEERDPRGAFLGPGRAIRSGGFSDKPKDCWVTSRGYADPEKPICGFRVLAVPTASLSGPLVHPAQRSRRSGKPFPHLYAQDEVTTNSIGMPLRRLQPGSFQMEAFQHEKNRLGGQAPSHKVTLTYPFSIGIYEVTQKQYETVMGRNPSEFKGDDLPVENLTRAEAQEFCKKLSEREKTVAYRLPTEAEWEYAA